MSQTTPSAVSLNAATTYRLQKFVVCKTSHAPKNSGPQETTPCQAGSKNRRLMGRFTKRLRFWDCCVRLIAAQ